MQRCQATTQHGVQCRRNAVTDETTCAQHRGDSCPVCLLTMAQGHLGLCLVTIPFTPGVSIAGSERRTHVPCAVHRSTSLSTK